MSLERTEKMDIDPRIKLVVISGKGISSTSNLTRSLDNELSLGYHLMKDGKDNGQNVVIIKPNIRKIALN